MIGGMKSVILAVILRIICFASATADFAAQSVVTIEHCERSVEPWESYGDK
jgi:hypothetical protein